MKKLTLIFLIALVSSGCATMADTRHAKGLGIVRIYNEPYDVVWNATLNVVASTKLQVVSANKAKGELLAKTGVTLRSYGEFVAIFVEEKNGKTQTRFEVVSKRRVATTVFSPDWESRIIVALDQRLN